MCWFLLDVIYTNTMHAWLMCYALFELEKFVVFRSFYFLFRVNTHISLERAQFFSSIHLWIREWFNIWLNFRQLFVPTHLQSIRHIASLAQQFVTDNFIFIKINCTLISVALLANGKKLPDSTSNSDQRLETRLTDVRIIYFGIPTDLPCVTWIESNQRARDWKRFLWSVDV